MICDILCDTGTYVTSVSASDGDVTSPNNEIIYQIETGSGDKFRIDARSGEISIERGADLDRDIFGARYALVVVAMDRGTPQLSGNATVYIEVTDVNNKAPTFSDDRHTVHLPESAAIWREAATYTATDLDESSQLRYGLLDDLVEGVRERNAEFEDHSYLAVSMVCSLLLYLSAYGTYLFFLLFPLCWSASGQLSLRCRPTATFVIFFHCSLLLVFSLHN